MKKLTRNEIGLLSKEFGILAEEFCKKHNLKSSGIKITYDENGFSISKISFLLLNEQPINYGTNPEQYIGRKFTTLKNGSFKIETVEDFIGFVAVSLRTGKKYNVSFSEMQKFRLEEN